MFLFAVWHNYGATDDMWYSLRQRISTGDFILRSVVVAVAVVAVVVAVAAAVAVVAVE